MQNWLKIKEACDYVDISERTFRDWMKDGLRFSRLRSGTILIKKAWIDEYLESFEATDNRVNDLISSLKL